MKTFLRANIASLTASFCDYLVTVILKSFLQFDPVFASILGTTFGGIINFLIGRYWVFKSSDALAIHQGKRYFIAWIGNLLLNAGGVYVLIEVVGLHYMVAKVITSLTVAFGYNYPIQKNYVFKNIDTDEKL